MNFAKTRFRYVFVILLSLAFGAKAQHVDILHDNHPVSLRGLSVVDENVVWVSGNKGTVGKSVDGGKTWQWITVPGYETRDFRDIEAFDRNTAVIIAVAEPAHILRTSDGGKSWKLVYENRKSGMFLDAMDFSNDRHGFVVGDAVNGKIFVAQTSDGGQSWKQTDHKYLAVDSAGCFASSGTNIRATGKSNYFFVLGGKSSRMISDNSSASLPFDTLKASTGANSLAIRMSGSRPDLFVTVGGDFANDTLRSKNCFISRDGLSWTSPAVPPSGYRSCVEFISPKSLISCGLNGVDISVDEGNTWRKVSSDSFHACRKAKKGNAIFLSGTNGRIGRLIMDK